MSFLLWLINCLINQRLWWHPLKARYVCIYSQKKHGLRNLFCDSSSFLKPQSVTPKGYFVISTLEENWDKGWNTWPGLDGQWMAKLGASASPKPESWFQAPPWDCAPPALGAGDSLRPRWACALAEKSTGHCGRSRASILNLSNRKLPHGSAGPQLCCEPNFDKPPLFPVHGVWLQSTSLPRTRQKRQRLTDLPSVPLLGWGSCLLHIHGCAMPSGPRWALSGENSIPNVRLGPCEEQFWLEIYIWWIH